MPPDLDVPEHPSLGQLDLSFTVKLQEGEEPHNHLDAFLTVFQQFPEPRVLLDS